jgi:hypothetical protein
MILAAHQPTVPLVDFQYLQQRFEVVQADMHKRNKSHMQDLVLCFFGGCVCFFLAAAAFRFFSARRTSVAYSALTEEVSEAE